jgi:LytS/YehU family sensor histidine kinase
MENTSGHQRWLDFFGTVTARDTEGNVTEVIGSAVDITEKRQAQEQREKLLRRETELRVLRAQLHPHVIFNALNRIASLVMSEPDQGRDLLVRLSRLLRATLLAGEKTATSCKEEIALLEDYVRLEKAGLEERLRFENLVPPGADAVRLPALSLFSIVEGAVRRGVGMRKEGATIRLRQKEPGVFRVEVDPPVPGGEAEFPPWPDPLWIERLEVERPHRARIVKETCPDGSVAAAELRLEPEV